MSSSRDEMDAFRELQAPLAPRWVSLMPENVLKELEPQQVRDLLRYLQSNGE